MVWTFNSQMSFLGGSYCEFIDYSTGAVHTYSGHSIPIDGDDGTFAKYYCCTNPSNSHAVAFTQFCDATTSTNLYKKYLYWSGPGNNPVTYDAPTGFEIMGAEFGPNTGALYLTCKRVSDGAGCILFSLTPQTPTSFGYLIDFNTNPVVWADFQSITERPAIQTVRFPGAKFGNFQGVAICSRSNGTFGAVSFEDSIDNLSLGTKTYIDANPINGSAFPWLSFCDSFIDSNGNAFVFITGDASTASFIKAEYRADHRVACFPVNFGLAVECMETMCPTPNKVLVAHANESYKIATKLLTVDPIGGTCTQSASYSSNIDMLGVFNTVIAKHDDGTKVILMQADNAAQSSYHIFTKQGQYQSSSVLGSYYGTYWSGQLLGRASYYVPTFAAAPSNFSATALSTTSISLQWTSRPDATVDIYRDGVLIGNSADTTFVDDGLTSGQEYQYYLRFTDGTEVSPNTTTIPCSTQSEVPDPIVPSIPIIYSVILGSDPSNEIRVYWYECDNATTYKIYAGGLYRGEFAGDDITTGTYFLNVYGEPDTGFRLYQGLYANLTGFAHGSRTSVYVVAVNGEQESQSAISYVWTLPTQPTVAIGSAGTTPTTGTLSWSGAENATSYAIYSGTTKVADVVNSPYELQNLTGNTLYDSFSVRACVLDTITGTVLENTVGAPSFSAFRTLVTQPVSVTITPHISNATITWAGTDAAGYNVYDDTTKLNTSMITGESPFSYALPVSLSANTLINAGRFSIRAVNTSGIEDTMNALVVPEFWTLAEQTSNVAAPLTGTNSVTIVWAGSGASSYRIYDGATLKATSSTNMVEITGLTANTSYANYTIRSVNGGGQENEMDPVNVGTFVTLATQPTVAGAVTPGVTGAAIRWSGTGASSYNIYLDGDLLGSSIDGQYDIQTGTLSPNTATGEGQITIRAVNSIGTENHDNPFSYPSFVTLATQPTVAGDFSGFTTTSATISWVATNATTYAIYFGASLLGSSATNSYGIPIDTLEPNTQIPAGQITVRSRNSANVENEASPLSIPAFWTLANPPVSIAVLSPEVTGLAGDSIITITWQDPASGAGNCNLYLDGESSKRNVNPVPSTFMGEPYAYRFGQDGGDNPPLAGNTSYTPVLKAVNGGGMENPNGFYGDAITTRPSTCSAPVAINPTTTSCTVSWSQPVGGNAEPLTYTLKDGELIVYNGVETSQTVSGLLPNTSHIFSVVAHNSAGESPSYSPASVPILTICSAPTGVSVASKTKTSLAIAFSTPAGEADPLNHKILLDGVEIPVEQVTIIKL